MHAGPALRAVGPSLVLLDVELGRVLRSWQDAETVAATLLRIDDPSANRWALAIEASNQSVLWIAVFDEITTALLLEQLRRAPGIDVTTAPDELSRWQEPLRVCLTHLLATESFVDFAGLEGLV